MSVQGTLIKGPANSWIIFDISQI